MTQQPKRHLRQREVLARYNIKSAATLYRWVASNGFPAPLKPSPGTSVWSEDELDQYDAQLAARRDAKRA